MQAIVMMLAVGAANVLGGAMTVPQVRQIFASRQVAGISPAWAAAGVASNAWWLAYGVGVGELAILPVSIIAVICYSAIVVGLCRFERDSSPVRGLGLGLMLGIIPVPFALIWGWATAGFVLGILYGVQLAPAVIEVFRGTDLSGVSTATWTMACVEAALWGMYAVPRRDVGVIVLGFVGVGMSAAVLARLTRWRRAELADRIQHRGSTGIASALSI